jgi:hypothetical protein
MVKTTVVSTIIYSLVNNWYKNKSLAASKSFTKQNGTPYVEVMSVCPTVT